MQWINFLHFYQPANIDAKAIEEATDKSYRRIVRAMEEHPRTRFTANISGCLILRWDDLGYQDLIDRIRALVERGQLELVGSAAYHPILPLISPEEAEAQIKENEEALEKYFGASPKGFFFPEMAYGPEAARIVKKLGYEYLVLDEISGSGKLGMIDPSRIYLDGNSGLKVLFRSRKLSQTYVPASLNQLAAGQRQAVFVTATDAELYGLRHNDPSAEFEKLLGRPDLDTQTVSAYMAGKPAEALALAASNWEATEAEISAKKNYELWNSRENGLHALLWELAGLAQEQARKFAHDKNHYWARWHLVRGLASCTFWWASGRDLRQVFGPVAWNPDYVGMGADELVRAIRSLEDPSSKPAKLEAEKLYLRIIETVWQTQWEKYWGN